MYTFDSRIRYSEIDANGTLSVTGIINYLQDCTTFHSEDMGVGVDYMKQVQKAWFLSSWKIEILRRPVLGERITTGTWHYGSKGIYAYRNFGMWDEEEKELVRADSIWILCDMKTGRPLRITEEDVLPYGSCRPRLEMGAVPRKIEIPKEYEQKAGIVVASHHIDTNQHVNNAKYVEIAREAWDSEKEISEIRADYKKAAVLGDILIPRIGKIGEEAVISLCREDGQPYAVVAFREKSVPDEEKGIEL